jgi:2'-hydroxyisoflavone reductase
VSETWDGVIDLARQPGHARSAVHALAGSVERWAFVSSKNVYRSHANAEDDESAETLAPLESDVMTSMEQYGAAKVACEEAVLEEFGGAALIARAGLIGGPGDVSGRSGYWPWRFACPSNEFGKVVVPGADIAASMIDVRDLARWLVGFATGATGGGIYDAVANRTSLGAHLDAAWSVAGGAAEMVPAESDWLVARGVTEWMGPRSLPLWIADPDWLGFGGHSGDKIMASGLNPRPLERTLSDVLAWEMTCPMSGPHGAGLTDQEQRELLADLDA